MFCDVQGRTKEQQQTDMGFQTNYGGGGIESLLLKHNNTHLFVGSLIGNVQMLNLSHTKGGCRILPHFHITPYVIIG